MTDLTVLYISASQVPEAWQRWQIKRLKEACGGSPIISVTRKPLDLGLNLLDTEPRSYWNIYQQMLRAARVAETPFVAMAEDDTLYTPEHFTQFRPKLDQVSYDRSRWSLFTWDPNPIFCLRQRISNCSLIAGREYLIEALEERAARWPIPPPNEKVGEVGRPIVERNLKVSHREAVEWYATSAIVQLNHLAGTDTGRYNRNAQGRRMFKKHGQIKAVEIPVWGRASDLVKRYR